MNQPLRSGMLGAVAVVAALFCVVALMIGTNIVLVRVWPPTSRPFLVVTLLAAFAIHTFGGGLGAVLARHRRPAIVALVLLGAAIMALSVVQTWAGMPPWYSLLMLAIAPAGLAFGASRMTRAKAQ